MHDLLYRNNKCYLLHNYRVCPEGFAVVLEKLEPQHLDHVVSQWYQDMREKCRCQCYIKYFDHIIRHCKSAVVFQAEEVMKPVAWALQYPHGQIGHRNMGFQNLILKKIIGEIKANGNLPELNMMDILNPSTLVKKLGFVCMYQTTCLVVKREKA